MKNVLSKHPMGWLLAGLVLVGGLYLFSLIDRSPDIDDAWLGELAYWQSQLGYAKSELMHGITRQEERFLPSHKLLTLQGAALIRWFGFSLVTLKSLSLLYLLLFLLLFYWYVYRKLFSPPEFWFSLLILISCVLIFEYSFVFRPELLVMTYGFLSYICLEKALSAPGKGIGWVVLAGFSAGLCVAAHLNGIIFVAAGFLLLAFNRRYIQALLFGLSSLPSIAIYFYDFTSVYNLSFWSYQLHETPAFEHPKSASTVWYYLVNLATEHQRYFHSLMEISLTVLLVVPMLLTFRKLSRHKNLLWYTLFLCLVLGIFSVHKTSKYLIPMMPYFVLIIVLSFRYALEMVAEQRILIPKATNKTALGFLYLLAGIFLGVNGFLDARVAFKKYNPQANHRVVEEYIHARPDTCRIVAPMTFIFNEITEFKRIQSDLCYTELQKSDPGLSGGRFLALTRTFGTHYIILTDDFIHRLGVDSLTPQELSDNGYQVLCQQKDLVVLKHR